MKAPSSNTAVVRVVVAPAAATATVIAMNLQSLKTIHRQKLLQSQSLILATCGNLTQSSRIIR